MDNSMISVRRTKPGLEDTNGAKGFLTTSFLYTTEHIL